MSSQHERHSPEEPDTQASVMAYFESLPAQSKEAWESLPEIASLGATFKSTAELLASTLVPSLSKREARVRLVEVADGPGGPRYTAILELNDLSSLIFRGYVERAEERGHEQVLLTAHLDDEELGTALRDWPFVEGMQGAARWQYRLDEDDDWQRSPEALAGAYAELHGSARPALSPLEESLSEEEAALLPSVLELEQWPVLGIDSAPER